MATVRVKDADGAIQTLEAPLAPGRAAAASSRPVALSNEDKSQLDALVTAAQSTAPVFVKSAGQEYEVVPASTSAILGAAGALGDILSHLIIIPAAANCGIVQIQDGGDAAITVFPGGGTVALTDLSARLIPLDLKSRTGVWTVITGANVSVLAAGDFT